MDTLRDGKSSLVNTNKLVRNYSGCTGLKTGSTSLALYNLSASATRDGLSLIAVVMKAPTPAIRFSSAQKLLDYGFNNYQMKSFGSKGDVVQEITVNKGTQKNVEVVLEENVGALISKGQTGEITQTINLEENINAPILEKQKIGEINYELDGKIVASVNLVSKNAVDKINFTTVLKDVMFNWFSLFRVA